jgi:hypothetical protein
MGCAVHLGIRCLRGNMPRYPSDHVPSFRPALPYHKISNIIPPQHDQRPQILPLRSNSSLPLPLRRPGSSLLNGRHLSSRPSQPAPGNGDPGRLLHTLGPRLPVRHDNPVELLPAVAVHKLPPREIIVTVFLPISPFEQGRFGFALHFSPYTLTSYPLMQIGQCSSAS